MHTILLTGFKPFGGHKLNDSETCVEIIKGSGLEEELNVHLVTEILEVSYNTALERVTNLWAQHNPFLVIHLGVHDKDIIRLEKCARKEGYNKKDVHGLCPARECCPLAQEQMIITKLDVSNLQNFSRGSYLIDHSENAGLYLCEYVYFISLSHDPSRTLFIHVPPYKGDTSPNEKAMVVKQIIKEMYLQCLNKFEEK